MNVTEWKIKKNHQNVPKTAIVGENLHFWRFFLIFSVKVLCKDLWFFCIAFSAPGRFFWATKINIWKKNHIFHHKGDPFDVGGVKINKFGFTSSYRGNKTISEILRVNALQKQSARHPSSFLVFLKKVIKLVSLVVVFITGKCSSGQYWPLANAVEENTGQGWTVVTNVGQYWPVQCWSLLASAVVVTTGQWRELAYWPVRGTCCSSWSDPGHRPVAATGCRQGHLQLQSEGSDPYSYSL